MIDHVSIQCADLEASAAFYDTVLATLGGRRIMDFGEALGYGADFPTFWLGRQATGTGFRESHLAFRAPDRAPVLHEPRVWPEYHPGYFGAFVRDPDGNNVEAVHHTFEPAD